MLFHKLSATDFGIGYVGKGGGTVAAVFCCICWYLAWHENDHAIFAVIITALITALGVWSGNRVEPLWGKDHSRVVIDEVAGQAIALLFVPVSLLYILAALVLFRFFDIAKPLLIRKLEGLPGGWGVMADDVLAGIYANIVLQVIILIYPFGS